MAVLPTIAFPDHTIDPRKKDDKWILQFAKAAWANFNISMPNGSIFYAKAARYQEIRDYAMGKQSITKYKKQLLSDDEADGSWMKIDWDPRTDGVVLRNIAVAKLQKAGYNILATPINAQAKDAEDEAFAAIKSKLLLRQSLMQKNSELANAPQLKKLPGEPDDTEELQMQVEFNPKLVRAKDIEESIQLVFYENESDKILDQIAEDLVDFGVAGIREYLDENNKVVMRAVKPGVFGCSYTEQKDFSDITWAFEVIPVKLSDLAKVFSPEDIEKLRNKVAGRNGNPSALGPNTYGNNGYDIFKADVIDIEFISWNQRVTEENKDANGNMRISKADPKKAGKSDKYSSKTIEVVYKAKWVVDTDLIYDYGIAADQKRTVEVKTMSKTTLSFHMQAASFNKMRAVGLTEQMIPTIDDLNIATYQLRNIRTQMIPNGFDIDIAALESVALGAGGKKMEPRQLIDMFFETGILISRRTGIGQDTNVNYKAIQPIVNSSGDQILSLGNDIASSKQTLRDISGLNELTDGSTPNPKTLTTIANLANESTNNALYYLVNARRGIINTSARSVVQRLQKAVIRGNYDGYNPSIGRWISVPKSIADYDYDIMIEDRPSDEQKQILYSLMTDDIKNGFISHADVVSIIYTNNLKQAAMLLSYKVQKGKEQQQNNAIQNTQATAQAQMQSNQAAETIKDEMADKQHQRELEQIDLEKSWDFLIQQEKNKEINNSATTKATTEILKIGINAGTQPGQPQQPNNGDLSAPPEAQQNTEVQQPTAP